MLIYKKGEKMKKIKFLLAILVCTLCSLVFVACGDDTPSDQTTPTYALTLTQSTEYSLSADKTNAEAFEQITISATLNTIDKKLVAIKYGTQTATQNSDGTFTFLMPAKDTTVSAVLEEFEEQLASDNTSKPFISFDKSNTKIIVPNTGEIDLYAPMNGSSMTILRKSIYSSNQNAIPKNAIRIEGRITSSSNMIIGADIYIDTSKVSKGYSWLEINFTNGNSTSQKGKLVFKITVDDVIQVETWTETLVFDISELDTKYTNSDFYIGISDLDHVNGMNCKSYQFFKNQKAENNLITITMEYAVTHRYSLSIGVIDEENSANSVWFNLMQSVGEGSSQTGYNQYKSKKLTFATPNSSLTIKAI